MFACAAGERCVSGACITETDGGGSEASTADASDATTTSDAFTADAASDGAANE